MAYSFENIRIFIPVLVDQSELTNGSVVFTLTPVKRLCLVSVSFVVQEAWGSDASVMSVELNDNELVELTIPGGTATGTEINKSAGIDTQIEAGTKIEFVAKSVNAQAGNGYFMIEYRELP